MIHKRNGRLRKAQRELKIIVKNLKVGYKPEKIILFGSLARQKITDSSDIDLLIIKRTHRRHWARLQEADSFVDHNFPIDILVYTPKEIKQRLKWGDVFVKDIVVNGKIIYEK